MSIALGRDNACNKCNRLCTHAKTVCISGSGPTDADILVLGEAPGADEDLSGTPFVGRAGRYMEKHIFRAAGIDRTMIRISNAVRCRPPNNKTPYIGEIRNCRVFLEREVAAIRPKVIVLLGNVALHSALPIHRRKSDDKEKTTSGISGITRWRGKQLWHPEFKCWVIPTWHPSGAMRIANAGILYRRDQTIEDFELALKLANKTLPQYRFPKTYFVSTENKALKVLESIMQSKVYAVDTETDGLDVHKDKLLGVSLSDNPNRGVYVDWSVFENSAPLKVKLQKLLYRKDRLRIFHNGSFDEKVFHFHGLKVGKYHDTMLAASLLDENFSKSLKDLTWVHLPFGGYDHELDEYRRVNKVKRFSEIPPEIMYKYASLDAVATLELYTAFKKELKLQKLWSHFVDRQMPTRRVLTQVEIGGFAVDLKYTKKLLDTTAAMVGALEKVVYGVAGYEFNINSRPQLGKVLFDDLKLPVVKHTPSGGRSTDKSVLEILSTCKNKRGRRLATALMFRSKVLKHQSTFIKPVLTYAWNDGKIHTRYNLMGTVTGRGSCSAPGIHNVPRDKAIRTQYVAEEDCSLVVTDIKSAELRALAHYSREVALINAFNEGRDVHSETFNIMYGKPSTYQPTDDERFIAKTINFGLIYGRGAVSLAEQLGVPVNEAYELIDQYFEKLPKAKKFLDGTVAFAKKHGYIVSLFGRRRRLPDIQTDDREAVARASRQAKNSLIQGTAAEITFLVMVRVFKEIARRRLRGRIVHTVHDSIIINSPECEVEDTIEVIKECFAMPILNFTVKLEVDIDVEKRWGEHKSSDLIDLYRKLKGGKL